jgi:hypothetical protein
MTADHSSYEELAAARRDSREYREGYAEARRSFLIGQAADALIRVMPVILICRG